MKEKLKITTNGDCVVDALLCPTKIKTGDTVKLTAQAIQTCRSYFGQEARWQGEAINNQYTVLNVIEDKVNNILMFEVQEEGKTETQQIAASHMEFVSRQVSIKELVRYVDYLGTEGGGTIEVTGTWKGKPRTIRIEQTEWSETEVCLVGGYGHDASALNPNSVSSVLDCVIGNYLDGETYHITTC